MRPVTTKGGSPETVGDASSAARTPRYEIRVQGRLGPRWTAWFDDMTVTAEDDGTTAIRGPVTDQAALHGLLQRLRDLAIPLVSVTQLPTDSSGPLGAPRTQEGN